MGHVSPSIIPRIAGRAGPIRYNGTHIGKVGPRAVEDDESDPLDSVDLLGTILVAEAIVESFFEPDSFADTEFDTN